MVNYFVSLFLNDRFYIKVNNKSVFFKSYCYSLIINITFFYIFAPA